VGEKLAESEAPGWGGALKMARGWTKESFELVTERSYWTTIADIKRERIPNGRGSYEKTSITKTSMDTGHTQ